MNRDDNKLIDLISIMKTDQYEECLTLFKNDAGK